MDFDHENRMQSQTELLDHVLLDTTSGLKRFINFFLDLIIIYLFSFAIGTVLGLLAEDVPVVLNFLIWISDMGGTGDYLFETLILITYYQLFEFAFSFTPAKILTRTKVVDIFGERPTFYVLLGRTICRFIPFDAFSFLGPSAVGWHDSISNTRVINDPRKKPILLPIIIVALIIIISGYGYMEAEGLIDSNDDEYSQKLESGINKYSYKDVSFNYLANWKIENEEIDNEFFQIYGEKKGFEAMESFSISILEYEVEQLDWIMSTIDEIKNDQIYKSVIFGDIIEVNFNNLNAYSVNFEGTYFNEDLYGEIIVVMNKSRSLLYIKLAGSMDKLFSDFEIIDNSIVMD